MAPSKAELAMAALEPAEGRITADRLAQVPADRRRDVADVVRHLIGLAQALAQDCAKGCRSAAPVATAPHDRRGGEQGAPVFSRW